MSPNCRWAWTSGRSHSDVCVPPHALRVWPTVSFSILEPSLTAFTGKESASHAIEAFLRNQSEDGAASQFGKMEDTTNAAIVVRRVPAFRALSVRAN